MPEGSDVAAFLGTPRDERAVELAEQHLPVVTAMVRRYVRGVGFDDYGPDDDLAAVIVSSTARAVSNPGHAVSQTMGPFSVQHGVFNGWTLPELAVLHSYRRRTA